MEINWFEICVEIINFIVLMGILKKFLYRPVLEIIQKRETNIKNIYQESQRKLDEGQTLVSQYEQKIQLIETERKEILEKAQRDIETDMEKIREENRIHLEKERKNFIEEFTAEKKEHLNLFKDFILENSLTLCEDIMKAFSSTSLEEQMLDNFLEELEEREELKNIRDIKKIKITLSHKISPSIKEKIISCFKKREILPENVEFLIDSSLILGYELNLGEFLISKNVKEIVSDYGKKLAENYD